jgi:hypothetical protein
MAGVLSFSNYLGGPDNINIEQMFPSTQRTLQYNFGHNILDWYFAAEQQTIVVNSMAFDRNGDPNFSDSTVIGYFDPVVIFDSAIAPSNYLNVVNAYTGVVNITLPTQMYVGSILPDARRNVPITVVTVKWTDAGTPAQINSHRWAFIQCWEPGVEPTDPIDFTGFHSLIV